MEFRNEDLKIRKVKIKEVKFYTKTEDYGRGHRQTDEYERIYYEKEDGGIGIIKTKNEATLFNKGEYCILANIDNEYLAYKHKGQNVEMSELITNKNISFYKIIRYIFLILLSFIPMGSIFIAGGMAFGLIEEGNEKNYKLSIFKYGFIEGNLFLINLLIGLVMFFYYAIEPQLFKTYVFTMDVYMIVNFLLSLITIIKYFFIMKELKNKKEIVKNLILKEIEKIEGKY